MTSKATAFDENTLRTRAYLLWEADGRPFGRDGHYWDLALAEATAPSAAVKPRRAAASAKTPEKKGKLVAKAAKSAAAKPTKAKAPVAKGKKK